MRENLSWKEIISIASLLFGMFFGAGNLIFPVHMGQLAGANTWPAVIGFVITGVTIPILGVAALGVSRSNNLLEMSSKVGRKYSMFFTCALYLAIGPFFAAPRCCVTPYTVGIAPIFGESALSLVIFSLIFFTAVLFFALKPSGILTWIGKIINPLFLIFLAVMVFVALFNPETTVSATAATGDYVDKAFFKGFLEGYGTMDGIASLAFGVIVITTIQGLGVKEPGAVCSNTIKAGIIAGVLMAIIYGLITVMGTQSLGYATVSDNGGIALADISNHYFGVIGTGILALIICFACLKTAIALVTGCAQIFMEMFPKAMTYEKWVILFTGFCFAVANVGLTAIITYAVPVLMLLYPLGITIILLALCGNFFNHAKAVYQWVTALTFIAAVFDFFNTLPAGIQAALHLDALVNAAYSVLPFAELGLGWLVPAILGLVIGLVVAKAKNQLVVTCKEISEAKNA